MRVSWNLVGRLIELGFDLAMKVDRWLDARKARKAPAPVPFIRDTAIRGSKTVKLPRHPR